MGGHPDAHEIHQAGERIAVCVGKGQRGLQALKWAIEKVVPLQGHVFLLHVKPPLRWIPNPLGGKLPVNQVNPEVVRRFAEDCHIDAQKIVSSYTKLCNRSKVTSEPIYAENDSVEKEIVYQITKLGIQKLILEISSQNAITRVLKKEGISAYVAKHAPDFCSVYVICKGKLCSVKDASTSDSDSSTWTLASETSSSSQKSLEDLVTDDDSSTADLQSAEEGMHPAYLSNASRPRLPQSASMDITRVSSELPSLYGNDSEPVQSAVIKGMFKNRSMLPPSRLSGFASVTPFCQGSEKVINWQRFDNDTEFSIAELNRQTVADNSNQDSPITVYTEKPGTLSNESFDVVINASQLVETNSSDCDTGFELRLETESSARSSVLEALSSQNSLTEMEIVRTDIHQETCNESLELNLLQGQLNEAKQHAQREAERQANNFKLAEDIIENARIKMSECERHREISANELRIATQKASQYEKDLQQTKALLQAALQKQKNLEERLAAEEQRYFMMQSELETARKVAGLKEQELQEKKRRCRELSSKLEEVMKQFEECRLRMEAEDERLAQEEQDFSEYSFKELELATNNFHEDNKLGQGGYGPVYKGKLHNMTVAIKVLAREGSQGRGEFQKEVELLSGLRHPHLMTLLGSCSEKGCLVYQYMANGSLEDRINCRDGTPPLPWRTRIRICVEIATALLFLHSRPQPIVHRDLKPGNILLDDQFCSKISDVGLAKLVPDNITFSVTMYKETVLVGTFAYMDPDYQRTGVISCESDVYSLGIIMLQLLTARPPIGLAYLVEEAVDKGQLVDILDKSAGQWPLDEATALASLSLQCTEPRRKNRPNLKSKLLPELERIHG